MKRIVLTCIFICGILADVFAIKTGKIKYDNGDIYIGSYIKKKGSKDKILQGQGTMYYATGIVFQGEWNYLPVKGTFTYEDGSTFTGKKKLKNNGLLDPSWDLLDQNWDGVLAYSTDCDISIDNNIWHIKSGMNFSGTIMSISTKNPQNGYFSEKIVNEKGDQFIGEIKNGKLSKGKYYYANVSTKNGWTIPAGCTFDGDMSSFSGTVDAIIVNAHGDKYIGNLENGKPDGQGELLNAAGDKYTGNFSGGKPNRQGVLLTAAGDKYTGNFKDGKPNGQGTMVYKDGRTESGLWHYGQSPSEYDAYIIALYDARLKEKEKEVYAGVSSVELCLTDELIHGAAIRLKQLYEGKKLVRFNNYIECIDIIEKNDCVVMQYNSYGMIHAVEIYSICICNDLPHELLDILEKDISYPKELKKELKNKYIFYGLCIKEEGYPYARKTFYPNEYIESLKKRAIDYWINKYGYSIGLAIANKEPKLGMTIEMIEDMLGSPSRRRKYLTDHKEVITLVYSHSIFSFSETHYEFTNNKLTEISSY